MLTEGDYMTFIAHKSYTCKTAEYPIRTCMRGFCEELDPVNAKCRKLAEICFRIEHGKKCEFIGHYDHIRDYQGNKPLAKRVKQIMEPRFFKEWKSFARDPRSGKKRMTGGPLEEAIRKVLKQELSPLGVTVYDRGKQFYVWRDKVRIIADCLLEMEARKAIVSVKTWVGTEQIRETFAYAYLAKTWLGQKNIRVNQIALFPFEEALKSLVKACMPYLDGVYSLSSEPYFDYLVDEMKTYFQS